MTGSILSRSTLSSSSLSSTQSQVDGLVGGFVEQATDWRSLAAMMAGGMAYRAGRVGVMGLGSGSALRVASVGLGLSAEVATFEGTHRGLSALSGEARLNPNLFRWEGNGGIRQGLLNSFVTFGTLKGAGRLAQGENVLIQHLLQDSGMVLGHHVTGAMGLAPRPTGSLAEQFLHAEATNLQLGAGMALAGRFAPGLPALERGLDLSLQRSSNEAPASSGTETSSLQPALAVAGGSGVGRSPAPRENPVRGPQILQMSTNEKGEGSTGSGPAAVEGSGLSSLPPATLPAVPRLITVRSQGDPPRQIDPEQTLGMLPMGSVGPHGNSRTTHQRAIGDNEWYAEAGEINGHLRYLGDGRYADAKTGEELNLNQIIERFGNQIEAETGFRLLDSYSLRSLGDGKYEDARTGQTLTLEQIEARLGVKIESEEQFRHLASLPLETDWAGQVIAGLRGKDGRTAEHLLERMGLTRKQIRELAFNNSSTYIENADQITAYQLYGLYDAVVKWGAALDEIVGHDPRQMALSFSSGEGGMSGRTRLYAASATRKIDKDAATHDTVPRTGTMDLAPTLIDATMGVLGVILGPKGSNFPETLTPESVIRTIGDIPVDVGACATGYKSLVRAANMFRPGWPGQIRTELSLFGSAEAPLGLPFARPGIVGFNGMKAMETRRQLEKRGGRIQDGYAPLTVQSNGFWISEGAGGGGIMRLSRLIELGLEVEAILTGYSVAGDEGGKPNPAGLGMGGTTATLEAMEMSRQWQGVNPHSLEYMFLHGTGTRNNNETEPANLLRVLNAYGYEGLLRLVAPKAFLGHGLGAAGSMELSLLMSVLHHQTGPGAFNLQGRELDPKVLALGDRVRVSPDVHRGPISIVGGQSQGFAGNNAAAFFRAVTDQILHEVYGYSIPQIEAYRRRLSERRGISRDWQERIRKGEATIGQFYSWFGLGSKPTLRQTFVDLAPAPSTETEGRPTEAPPQTMPASPHAMDLPRDEPPSVAMPPVLDPKAATLNGTLDLMNSLWKAPEAEARALFIEMDRRSGALNPEENHILATVLKVGLSHEEPRRRAVALTGLAPVVSRIDPALRLELVEQILPRLSDPDSDVRGAAANALVHAGLALTPAEIARIDLGIVDQALSKEDPAGRSEALLVLCSHYPLLPPSERPFAARHILEGFHRQDRLALPHLVLRKILQDLPEESRQDFAIWLASGFPEERDSLLQAYSQVLSEITSKTPTLVPEPEPVTRGPEIMTRTIFPIPPDQVVVTIGEGAGITPLGSMRTTRRIAVGEADAIAHMAEDAGYVRYAGIENGATQWRDRETGNPILLDQIEARWGRSLREQSGIRTLDRLPLNDRTRQLTIELLREVIPTLPEGSERRNLLVAELEKLEKHPIDSMVADFAGVIPSYMRDSLYEKMGLTFSEIGKTRIGGSHYKNVLKSASQQTRLYLWGAMEVLNQLGGRLPDLYPHSRKVGFAFGAAFEGWDALVKLIDTHRRGGNFGGLDTPLPDALISHPPAVMANMLGPQFNYSMLKKNPAALQGIVPPNMDPRVGPNTMGPVYTEVAACASAFYALAAGAQALTSRLPGQFRPELMILGASDAALSPLATPFIVTAFSDVAPIKRARLIELGLTPAQASMPLNRDASGLVISDAAGGINLGTLPHAVVKRQMISAIVAGWGLSLGEGGKEMLMGMDEGSVGATLDAINMGIEGHGLTPRDVKVVQLHGTSTRLNNLAEMISLYKVFGAYGGERARPILNALKGLIGHSMGAASIVDLLNAVATLREQRAPRLFNFSMDQIDERFADTSKTHLPEDLASAFRFPTETVQEPIEAVLGISEGFGSRNSAVLLRRFDPTILRHYDWSGEMKPKVEDFIAAWPDIVAKYEADQLELRSGRRTRAQLVLDNAYPNPVLK